MYAVVILSFAALAGNIASGTKEYSPSVSDRVLKIVGHQLTSIIGSRGDTRNGYSESSYSDAINFETQHVHLCGPILCISANLTKGSVSGLAQYEIFKLDFNSEFNSEGTRVDINIDIGVPKLLLDADYYSMKGNIMEALPLAGEGKLHFQATGLRFWTKILLQVSDRTSIENFENSGFSIDSILSRTEFDGNIDGVLNAMVEELLVEHLNRFNRAIAKHCLGSLKQVLNPLLD